MTRKLAISLCIFLLLFSSVHVKAQEFKYVEIFDPKKDKVVKLVQLNPEIQSLVAGWIKDIKSLYGGGIDPVTDDGYAVKVPLAPPLKVNNDCLKATVYEVFILVPENKPPFYMIFENETKLTCFAFNGDINKLSKALGFKLSRRW
jgi:hypothetical protein